MTRTRSARQLRDDAIAIWQAGVDAVRGDRLIADNVHVQDGSLLVGDEELTLDQIRRIVVVGAGKAGAGMAAGLESALGSRLLAEKRVAGIVNVPEDCVRPLTHIELHAARPAGVNEPRPEGVVGATGILDLIASLDERDLCICLISGGGSALLPLPAPGISLADKQAVTRFLSAAGANIQELNTVRKQLSRVKGGGLARACRAGQLVTLIISDVIGDPLDIIASGPTVPNTTTREDALQLLDRFNARGRIPDSVFAHLTSAPPVETNSACKVTNLVIGNNAVAVDAAGMEAERRGYSHAMLAARELEGDAEDVGRQLAVHAVRMRAESGPDCLITGGEPVVQLCDAAIRGRGGRNQQLVLAALQALVESGHSEDGIVILSGGTDGEDGPTDAAGAWLDAETLRLARDDTTSIASALARNDAYSYFKQQGTLLVTGPTHTNVCDIRVAVVDRVQPQ